MFTVFTNIAHLVPIIVYLVLSCEYCLVFFMCFYFTQGVSCLLRWVRNIDDELHALIAGKAGLCKLSNKIPSEQSSSGFLFHVTSYFSCLTVVSFPFSLSCKASWLVCQCFSTEARQYRCISSQS